MNSHRPDCPCRNLQRKYSLITAAEFGVVSSEHLLSDASSKLSSGYSPLHLAAQHNNIESTKLLLTQSNICVDGIPKSRGGCGATPLHRASFSGAYSCMKLLLEHGANLFAQDESFGDLMSPLHKAVSAGRYNAVKLILNSVTNESDSKRLLQLMDARGRTALNMIQEILSSSESYDERCRSVARWNQIAGGEPDWNLSLTILKDAHMNLGLPVTFLKVNQSHRISRNPNSENDPLEFRTSFGIKVRNQICMPCDDEKKTKSFFFNGQSPLQPSDSIMRSESDQVNVANKVQWKRNDKKTDKGDPPNASPVEYSKTTKENGNYKEKSRLSSNTGQRCGICTKLCLVLSRSKDKKTLVCRSCRRLNRTSKYESHTTT